MSKKKYVSNLIREKVSPSEKRKEAIKSKQRYFNCKFIWTIINGFLIWTRARTRQRYSFFVVEENDSIEFEAVTWSERALIRSLLSCFFRLKDHTVSREFLYLSQILTHECRRCIYGIYYAKLIKCDSPYSNVSACFFLLLVTTIVSTSALLFHLMFVLD